MRAAMIRTMNQMGPMRLGMMACCAFMLLPVGAFLWAGGSVASRSSNLTVFAPLLFCLGAHLLLHRFIGGLCHGKTEKIESALSDGRETAETVPAQR